MAKTVLEIPSPAMLLSTADLLRKSQGLRMECIERRMKLQFVLRTSETQIRRSRTLIARTPLVYRYRAPWLSCPAALRIMGTALLHSPH